MHRGRLPPLNSRTHPPSVITEEADDTGRVLSNPSGDMVFSPASGLQPKNHQHHQHQPPPPHQEGRQQGVERMAVPPSRAVSTITILPSSNKVAPVGPVKKEHAILLKKYKKRRGSTTSSANIFAEENANPSWIRENLYMRECIRYTDKPPSKNDKGKPAEPKCQCGKKKKKHEERFQVNSDKSAKWKVETHTHTCNTNAYGEIEFMGAVGGGAQQKPRKFVRVEQATPSGKLQQLMSEVWNLSQPKLLISVTGGARNFPLNHRLKDVFRKGLIKAASSTGAWIITGGTHAGVMKYVGEAVRDHALANGRSNVVAIGIASWGVLAHRDKLQDENNVNGKFPAYYNMDAKKGILLDPNHTHFILVDNGTIDQFGVEIKLRGKLEKAISEQKLSRGGSGDSNVSVPVVCVVVEGGPNTIQTAYEAIMNGTPAVVVAGSGRAADILAYAFKNTKEYKTKDAKGTEIVKNVMREDVKLEVAKMISKEFGDKELEVHLNRIEACIQRKHLVTVYELGASTTMDIDGAILHALLKANKGRIQDQLRLALIWNRVDVAKREIFTDDHEWGKGQLNEALHYAIANNQVDFIDLFLEQGVNLKDYLTVKELTLLYNEIRTNTLVYELLEKQRGRNLSTKFNLENVGKVIRDLTFDTYEPLYLSDGRYILTDDEITRKDMKRNKKDAILWDSDDDSEDEIDANETGAVPFLPQNVLSEGLANMGHSMVPASFNKAGLMSNQFEHPLRELFILSILQNRHDIAKLFWEEGKESIAGALTASKILKSMASKEDDSDQSANMREHAETYEELAIGVLNECYEEDEERSALLLVCELPFWGKSTCLNLAVNAQDMHFIAHSGVQNLLNQIWMGKISEETSTLQLWMCTLCPPLIYFIIKFREDEENEDDESSTIKKKLSKKRKGELPPNSGEKRIQNRQVNAIQNQQSKECEVVELPISMDELKSGKPAVTPAVTPAATPAVTPAVTFSSDNSNKSKDRPGNGSPQDEVFQVAEDRPLQKDLQMVSIHPPSDNGDTPSTSHAQLINDKNGHASLPKEKDEDTFSLLNAQLDIRDSGKELEWYQRFKYFYDAPMITFRHNVASYILFLVLYSYIMVFNFHKQISPYEIVLIIWCVSLFTEEFRQIAQGESSSWWIRLVAWISDYWNLIDLATLTLFALGTVMRFFPDILLDEARIILSLNLIIFYIRLLHIFSVNKQLGPKLIMIQRMMVDLTFFLCILLVFMVGYGIASQAILFPNETDLALVARGVFMRSYFQIFGELFLEVIEGVDCSNNATLVDGINVNPCPEYSWIGIVLLALYMMISNVLLLNLLIAMFSYTFSAIQDNTDIFWKFQRYELIKEYFNRPPLIPPFIIISHLLYFVRFILNKCCSICASWHIPELKQSLTDQEIKTLVVWEGINADNYTARQRILVQQDINERVKLTGERVEGMTNKLFQVFDDSDSKGSGLGMLGSKGLEERLVRLEDRMERTNDALDWIIDALRSSGGMGVKAAPPKLKEIKGKTDSLDVEEEELKHLVPVSIEELGIMIHQKSRASPYPGTVIRRFPVPDNKVPWETDFPQYDPINYTHQCVLDNPHWADKDLLGMLPRERTILHFNQMDAEHKYNRKSHMKAYSIKDGLPLNPKGRTGITGRGLLGRFGPNHAADPIATRWKKNPDGTTMTDDSLPVLEFISIQRVDNQQWAIPGGMVEPGDVVSATLKREFSEEALGTLNKTEEEQDMIRQQVEKLFDQGVEVYKGYVDDPRNTDNAWMETVAMNFHDEDGSAFGSFNLEASDDAQSVRWQRVSSKIRLFASHTAMLREVAKLHKAAF